MTMERNPKAEEISDVSNQKQRRTVQRLEGMLRYKKAQAEYMAVSGYKEDTQQSVQADIAALRYAAKELRELYEMEQNPSLDSQPVRPATYCEEPAP